ncbi:hypothetical protein ACS0PU_006201 [Formica fusca]
MDWRSGNLTHPCVSRLDRQVRFALANYTSTIIQKSVTILGWVCELPPRENVSCSGGAGESNPKINVTDNRMYATLSRHRHRCRVDYYAIVPREKFLNVSRLN